VAAKEPPSQLAFDFDAPREKPKLRVLKGGGERRHEKLASRDAVARVMMEAGADLLLRRISSVRAEEIDRQVNAILDLFDAVDRDPGRLPALQSALEDLEALMTDTREKRARR
jgi:hypothetical protein